MSSLTSNLNLVKYDVSDKITPLGYNQNFDKIDDAISKLQTDFIVSQGTQDVWRYRRWNSGLSELWCSVSLSQMTLTLPTHRAISVEFPFTFKNIPFGLVSTSSSVSASDYGTIECAIRSLTTTSCQIQAGYNLALTDLYVNAYIVGGI